MTAKPRILVVDDDESILDFVSAALGDEGYEVETVADGRSALQAIDRQPPDLILLDMRMPVMDGWEFASVYAARPGAHAPIIVLTAAQDAAGLTHEIGAAGYVGKPFTLDHLLEVVQKHSDAVREESASTVPSAQASG